MEKLKSDNQSYNRFTFSLQKYIRADLNKVFKADNIQSYTSKIYVQIHVLVVPNQTRIHSKTIHVVPFEPNYNNYV